MRLCNSFWRPQTFLKPFFEVEQLCDEGVEDGRFCNIGPQDLNIDNMLRGMQATLAEREDEKIVEDLQRFVFGPFQVCSFPSCIVIASVDL